MNSQGKGEAPGRIPEPRELKTEAISIIQKWRASNAIACKDCGLPASTYYLADLIDRAITVHSASVEALEAEVARLSAQNERVIRDNLALIDMGDVDGKRIEALVEALRELVNSPVEFDDPRISYVTVQVDKRTIEAARAALAQVGEQAREEGVKRK